ncbi:MAG: WG repeat-containing protein, partial [Bacteroidia bacterium]
MKQLFLLTFTLCFLSIQAQTNTYKRCLYTGRWAAGSDSLPPDKAIPVDDPVPNLNFHHEVETALQEIIKLSGIEGRKINLKHSSSIALMVAEDNSIHPKTIYYNSINMRLAIAEYKNTGGEGKWVLYGILAHEIGHILYNHFVPADRQGKTAHTCEFEADAFAARMLYRMGANHAQLQAPYLDPTLLTEKATATHPPRSERIDAALKVWEKEGGKLGVSMLREYEYYPRLTETYYIGDNILLAKTGRIICTGFVGEPKNSIIKVKKDSKYGYINEKGEYICPIKYDYVADTFSEGRAIAYLGKKCGFIDINGKEIISLNYDGVGVFSNGRAGVRLGEKEGFIGLSGELIVPIKYDYVGDFHENRAWVKSEGKYGFIDINGKAITPVKYNEVGNFCNQRTWFKFNGKYGFIDINGEEVVPPMYDNVALFYGQRAWITSRSDHGLIDTKNGNVIIPINHQSYYSWDRELIIVREIGDKCTIFNKQGKLITFGKYDWEYRYSEGLYPAIHSQNRIMVGLNGYYGLIDSTGKEITSIKYEEIGKFYEDRAKVRFDDGNYNFLDKDGEEITYVRYYKVSDYSEGMAFVRVDREGKWGVIDINGKEVTPMKYEEYPSEYHNG